MQQLFAPLKAKLENPEGSILSPPYFERAVLNRALYL